MHSKIGNIEIMIHNKEGWKHQWKLVTFSLIVLICCITNVKKISLKRCVSYIYSPDWIKNNKKKTTSFTNDDDKHFPDAATVALNHEEIEKNLQRISNINSILDGLFRSCSRIRGGSKPTPPPAPPSLKCFTHILQRWNLAVTPYLKKIWKLY